MTGVESYLPIVLWLAGRLMRQYGDARMAFYGVTKDDLISAGSLALVEASRSYRQDKASSFRSWAFLKASGYMRDSLRQAGVCGNRAPARPFQFSSFDGEGDDAAFEQTLVDSQADDVSQEIIDAEMRRIVEGLPPAMRQVIILRYYKGRQVNQIAARLGKSCMQVQSVERKAREKLRYALRDWV